MGAKQDDIPAERGFIDPAARPPRRRSDKLEAVVYEGELEKPAGRRACSVRFGLLRLAACRHKLLAT